MSDRLIILRRCGYTRTKTIVQIVFNRHISFHHRFLVFSTHSQLPVISYITYGFFSLRILVYILSMLTYFTISMFRVNADILLNCYWT